MTTALAFLGGKKDEPSRQPWLFRFTVGPVQRFIEDSRKTRDLWVSSFILSDLVWHAMEPIIERYGPDVIIYPDLRGNARADCWLAENEKSYPGALPDYLEGNPSTFAAVIPNGFTAILPQGEKSDFLASLEDLAEEAAKAVQSRWSELADVVWNWLSKKNELVGLRSSIEPLWKRQHQSVFHTAWTAVPWLPMEPLTLPAGVKIPPWDFLLQRALPAQRPDFRPELSPENRLALRQREERLAPWMPPEVWYHYEWARGVYARTNLKWHQMERGFDYALTHHQLLVRHAIGKLTRREALDWEEEGEKCTLCGTRQALAPDEAQEDRIGEAVDNRRQGARRLWAELDRDGEGRERLCAVCTVKRFLVEAGGADKGINPLWAGIKTPRDEIEDEDGVTRVPFPSTATLAAQEYLEALVRQPALQSLIGEMVELCRHEKLKVRFLTAFPRALPRLASAARKSPFRSLAEKFLRIETQVLFPETLDAELRRLEAPLMQTAKPRKSSWKKRLAERDEEALEKLNRLKDTSKRLKDAARSLGLNPRTHYAVLVADGDAMHRLLLGDKDTIHARWRDVIHPDLLPRFPDNKHLMDAGWGSLLEAHRLMGPSLHAYVSRALASFSNRIVPWVVEREFSGRLIYSGGDDILALVDEKQAIDLAARLQQLFSAAWIIDTSFDKDPWAWRRTTWDADYDQEEARGRFIIPCMGDGNEPVEMPVKWVQPHVAAQKWPHPEWRTATEKGFAGPVLPMLGPWCSLSAGIACGHFKTSLSLMIRQARTLLDKVAKKQMERRAMAVSVFSRNGVKATFGIHWGERGRPPGDHLVLHTVREAFAKGKLARRLPYKLRTLATAASAAMEKMTAMGKERENDEAIFDKERRLLTGFVYQAIEGGDVDDNIVEAVVSVWQGGFHLFPKKPERSVDGLLLCRALSGPDEENGE